MLWSITSPELLLVVLHVQLRSHVYNSMLPHHYHGWYSTCVPHGAPEEDQCLAIEFPALVGKLLHLLARPNMDTPDDIGYLGFGLLFAHTLLFWLLPPKPDSQAKAGENPTHHALKNVACGVFNCQFSLAYSRQRSARIRLFCRCTPTASEVYFLLQRIAQVQEVTETPRNRCFDSSGI